MFELVQKDESKFRIRAATIYLFYVLRIANLTEVAHV
jgi:hypothetical protein